MSSGCAYGRAGALKSDCNKSYPFGRSTGVAGEECSGMAANRVEGS